MVNLTKLFLTLIVIGFLISVTSLIMAQETSPAEEATGVGGGYSPIPTVEEAINLDEDVQPQDLGISEPKVLPDSPLYFFKNFGRTVQSIFTFNPISKAELKLKFANEKLMEAKKLAEKEQSSEIIKKGLENYQKEVEGIKATTEKIKEKASDNPEVGKFLDKFIQQQTLHQKVLQKLENQVKPEVFEKIAEAREKHLETFGEVMNQLENKEKLQERIEKNLEEIKGSEFKEFKNLEILKALEEKAPEAAKEAIKNAQENSLNKLKENLEAMSSHDQEKFKEYSEKISGAKEKQLEILQNLNAELKEKPQIKEMIMEAREKILEKIEEKAEKINCPPIEKPVSGFCQEGRIIAKNNEKGCIISFECVIPAEAAMPKKTISPEQTEKPAACITLWNPVCGKDGKTYSNECFAKTNGIEIEYKGICQREGTPLPKESPGPLPKESPGPLPKQSPGLQQQIIENIKELPGKILPKISPQKLETGTNIESTPAPFVPKPSP